MSFQGDPYRVLGLPAGANQADVKRAYRILAKRYHPDSAGESALPTFLAIQAAYEHLVHEPDRRRPGVRPSRGAPPAPDPAWRADPDRARAARDRWRARASGTADRPSSAGPSSSGRAAGPSGGTSARPGGRENAGSRSGTGGRESTGGRPSAGGRATPGTRASAARPPGEPGTGDPRPGGTRRGRATRKASLGSTSYDDVAGGPLDANWEGAGWYGATSGTYWTLNPKEYADPRKHGPEYAARARRVREAREAREARVVSGRGPTPTTRSAAAGGRSAGEGEGARDRAEGGTAARASASSSDRPWPPRADWHGARTRGSSRGWDWAGSVPPAGEGAARTRPRQADDRPTRPWNAPSPNGERDGDRGRADPGADGRFPGGQGASSRRWTDRLLPALLGWPPIGFAIVAVAGQLTGCDRYAASCSTNVREPFGILTWAVQLAVLAILVAAPTVARLAASGTLALLAAAAPAAFLFAASGGTRDEVSAANALAVVLVAAWLAGLALAATGRLDLVDRLGRHAAGPPG